MKKENPYLRLKKQKKELLSIAKQAGFNTKNPIDMLEWQAHIRLIRKAMYEEICDTITKNPHLSVDEIISVYRKRNKL